MGQYTLNHEIYKSIQEQVIKWDIRGKYHINVWEFLLVIRISAFILLVWQYIERKHREKEKNYTLQRLSVGIDPSMFCLSFSLSPPSGHLCVGFTLCSGPLRLCGSCSDGSVSLGLQPHREDPGGLSIWRTVGGVSIILCLFGVDPFYCIKVLYDYSQLSVLLIAKIY